jgi:hypothetical protein
MAKLMLCWEGRKMLEMDARAKVIGIITVGPDIYNI